MCSASTRHIELLTEFAPRLLPATTNIRPLTGSQVEISKLYTTNCVGGTTHRWVVLTYTLVAAPTCGHCSARPFTTNAIGVGEPDGLLIAAENTMLLASFVSALGDAGALSIETRLSTAG